MSSIQYQRLGHFSLNDNTKNNYKSRELKSVFLDHQCKYLKILFSKPYFNKYNPFNQIGIVRIVCHGAILNDYEVQYNIQNYSMSQENMDQSGTQPQMPQSIESKIDLINEDMLDPIIKDKLDLLNKNKQKYVEREDFDKAKDIKLIIDKIKILGAQIAKMEFQKKQSIEADDFDTSKMLKFEIERLRDAALEIDTDRLLTPLQKYPKMYQKMPEDVIETEVDLIEKSIKDLQEIEEEDYEEDEIMQLPPAPVPGERQIKPAPPDLYSGNYNYEAIEQKRTEYEKRIALKSAHRK